MSLVTGFLLNFGNLFNRLVDGDHVLARVQVVDTDSPIFQVNAHEITFGAESHTDWDGVVLHQLQKLCADFRFVGCVGWEIVGRRVPNLEKSALIDRYAEIIAPVHQDKPYGMLMYVQYLDHVLTEIVGFLLLFISFFLFLLSYIVTDSQNVILLVILVGIWLLV